MFDSVGLTGTCECTSCWDIRSTWIVSLLYIGCLGYELGCCCHLNFLVFASEIRRAISFMVTDLFCRAIWHLASFGRNLLSSSSGHKNEAHYVCVYFCVLKNYAVRVFRPHGFACQHICPNHYYYYYYYYYYYFHIVQVKICCHLTACLEFLALHIGHTMKEGNIPSPLLHLISAVELRPEPDKSNALSHILFLCPS